MDALTLTLAMLALSDSPVARSPPDANAQLSVDCQAVDFGTLARYAAREALLHIRNATDNSVAITRTDSDCTCLTSTAEARRLEAGQTAEWRVTLNVCDYLGEVRRHVWLETDAPTAKRLRVPVRYRVVPELFARPELVSLGLIGDEPVATLAFVETCDERSFRLLGATCNDPAVDVQIESDVVAPGRPGTVRIEAHAPVTEGRFRPIVWVETTSDAVPRVRVPLYGESVRGLRCEQRELALDSLVSGQSHACTVTFTCEPPLRIDGARTSDEELDVESVTHAGDRVAVSLRMASDLPLGEFRGFLILEIHDGQARRIKLPYRGRVVASTPAPVITAETVSGGKAEPCEHREQANPAPSPTEGSRSR